MLAGVAFLGATIAFVKVSGVIQFYSTPSFAKNLGYVSKYESGGDSSSGKDVGESEFDEEEVASGKMRKMLEPCSRKLLEGAKPGPSRFEDV